MTFEKHICKVKFQQNIVSTSLFVLLLWRNLTPNHRPEVYEFERVNFGETSAPLRAQYVIEEHALEQNIHLQQKPLKMEDSLDSNRTDEKAI